MEKHCRSVSTAIPPSFSSPTTNTTTSAAAAAVASFSSNPRSTTASNRNASSVVSGSFSTNFTLRNLNKSSHKISKPISRICNPNPIRPAPPSSSAISSAGGDEKQQPPQPPVYNIDKNNFRNLVQKLTGWPAHPHVSHPPSSAAAAVISPPPPPPSSPSAPVQPLSRLHRIRPPPLAQLCTRPPPSVPAAASAVGEGWVRPPPLSPLPPFPSVNATAESPISAYMRRLHSGQVLLAPSPPGLPLSPLAFGWAPSPRTAVAYQPMFPPAADFHGSPRLPIPSPK
ncbi:hypothetical protein AXF42_Ash010791 [Apostasia shenzhenica]|uniref:VQ domain-containing protein n=1 Tax=Apostasia shenzhenica TaxID=1088818 RepID=A0A2I0A0P2_9ASPA|nr:hypothetical protein AXF42_Ash010791 [Apostasia shenzhenica]